MRFAPAALADMFSAERTGDIEAAFGYHGVWNMPNAIGHEAFWQVYCGLDERGTVWTDFTSLLKDAARGDGGGIRVARMILDRLRQLLLPGH